LFVIASSVNCPPVVVVVVVVLASCNHCPSSLVGGGLLQVMLLGDSSVGKTCVLVRFKDGAFLGGNFIATVGIDFRVRETLLNRMAHYNVYHVCLFMVCSLVTIMGETFSKR